MIGRSDVGVHCPTAGQEAFGADFDADGGLPDVVPLDEKVADAALLAADVPYAAGLDAQVVDIDDDAVAGLKTAYHSESYAVAVAGVTAEVGNFLLPRVGTAYGQRVDWSEVVVSQRRIVAYANFDACIGIGGAQFHSGEQRGDVVADFGPDGNGPMSALIVRTAKHKERSRSGDVLDASDLRVASVGVVKIFLPHPARWQYVWSDAVVVKVFDYRGRHYSAKGPERGAANTARSHIVALAADEDAVKCIGIQPCKRQLIAGHRLRDAVYAHNKGACRVGCRPVQLCRVGRHVGDNNAADRVVASD